MQKNKTMKIRNWLGSCSCVAIFGLALSSEVVNAQTYFTYTQYGDLLLGFRKPGVGNYELVVNIGNITNFVRQTAGTSVPVNNFSPAQLSDAFSDYNNLQWSVNATFKGTPSWAQYPLCTLWFTVPRTDTNSQTTPPIRQSVSAQANIRAPILSIGSGANTISTQYGTTNNDNNSVLVREPINNTYNLSSFIADPSDATIANFGGQLSFTVENTTPASFNSPVRSDLYQSCPDSYTDPTTGLTTGSAYFVGYFTFNPNGTMSFTRASNVAPPPPPPVLTITRTNNTSTISFLSTNGATYTLYYTNTAGLAKPISTWPSAVGTLGGNNATIGFQDTTAASDRVYRVKVQ
jgi:hypothetical protein